MRTSFRATVVRGAVAVGLAVWVGGGLGGGLGGGTGWGAASGQQPGGAATRAAGSYKAGDVVEIELGGKWLAGRVLRVMTDGTYFVRFDQLGEANDDFVPAGRLRTRAGGGAGGDAGGGAGQGGAPDGSPAAGAATQPPRKRFTVGQRVQVKAERFDNWSDCTIARVGRYHYYVTRDDRFTDWDDEWVPESRIRARSGPAKPAMKRDRNVGPKPKPIPPEPPKPADAATEADADGNQVVGGDLLDARSVDTVEASVAYVPDAGPIGRAPGGAMELRVIEKERVAGLLFTPGTLLGAVYDDGPISASSAYAPRLERFDLAGSRSVGVSQLPGKTRVLAVSPGGTRALATEDGWAVSNPTIAYLFDITKPEAGEVARFQPYTQSGSKAWHAISWAAFVTDEVVLTHGIAGVLAAWDLSVPPGKPPKAIWQVEGTGMWAAYALSPTRKYVLVSARDRAVLVEAATGATALVLPGVDVSRAKTAFSPDGTRLAAVEAERLRVWDLTTKQLLHDTMAPEGGEPAFLEDDLLVAGPVLIDLRAGVPLWSFEGGSMHTPRFGRLYYVDRPEAYRGPERGGRPRLRSVALPGPEALAARSKLTATDPAKLFALYPGATVKLDLQTGDGSEGKVAEMLTGVLAGVGIKVGESSRVRLVARVEPGETKRIPYKSFGQMFGSKDDEVNFQERKWRMAIEVEGKTVWQRSSVERAPPNLILEKGESVEAAVERQRLKPERFFSSVSFPARVPNPEYVRGLGQTRLP